MLKKVNNVITIIILAIATVNTSMPVYAADKPTEKVTEVPKKKVKGMPFNGKVSGVDKPSKSITLEGKEKARTFQITSETKISKDKKPATLEEVIVGDNVGGYARENAEGKLEVVTLNLKPAAPKAKEGEKKSK